MLSNERKLKSVGALPADSGKSAHTGEEARIIFESAKQAASEGWGDEETLLNLADCYAHGVGTVSNKKKAAEIHHQLDR